MKQATFVALALVCICAAAQNRYVAVNGQRLNTAQIEQLERARCAPIPNGRYWLNLQTTAWGYAGDPRPQGRLSDPCHSVQQARRPSLSERGLLYSPGDKAGVYVYPR